MHAVALRSLLRNKLTIHVEAPHKPTTLLLDPKTNQEGGSGTLPSLPGKRHLPTVTLAHFLLPMPDLSLYKVGVVLSLQDCGSSRGKTLRACQVNVGDEANPVTVVTAASNVREGSR